ncbi:MAG: fibro-slime domain-containing protein [Planctomycetota bacterium]
MTRRLPATAKLFAAAFSTAAMCLPFGLSAHATGSGASEDDGTIQLTGIIRDFEVDHPDFETFPGTYNKVLTTLGYDAKPRLDLDYLSWSHSSGKQSVTSEATFAQWFNDTPEVNMSMPHTIVLQPHDTKENVFWFAREKQMSGDLKYFFPIDDKGFGKSYAKNGHRLRWASEGKHNFHFTYELETEFTYTDPAERDYALEFKFTGDDDVWVFINNQLVIDLGGVHSQKSASVNVDDIASDLSLEHLGTYTLKVFFAERHTSESNFRIETTMKLKEVPPTVVSPLFD